jgi:hypothetical protein
MLSLIFARSIKADLIDTDYAPKNIGKDLEAQALMNLADA